VEDTTLTSSRGPAVLAIGVAVLAFLLSIFALGRALATPTGAVTVTDASGAAAAASVAVELSEFAITPSDISVPAGGTLEVANAGAAPHNLKIKDSDIATADLDAGASASLDLAGLEPGTYQLWCDIAGHEAAGMSASLTVTDSDAAAPAADATDASGDHSAHGGGDWQATYDTMKASIEAFPAETAGTGAEVMEPEVLDDGTKVFELTVDEIDWEVETGKVVQGVAYNGQIPGPTIKLDVGDKVKFVVHNELDEITSLHPHGVHQLPFKVDGVGFISQDPIKPGETWEGEFVAKEGAVGMYHGHDMGLHQVPNGLAGAIIIGDLPLPDGIDELTGGEHVMMLNDAGNIGFSLNGKSFPATTPYSMKKGETMLVHYMNEGLMPHPMHLHGQRQLVIAKDGFPLDSPYYADTINVAPGERYSVLVTAEQKGVWVWHCHIFTHVERDDGSMFGMLTALIVE
jgi:manganese oxidase